MKKSKRYKLIIEQFGHEKKQEYSFEDACKLLIESSQKNKVKFTESVDIAMHLNLEQKHSIKDSIAFPHHDFLGERKVLVFAQGAKIDEALDAGATHAGGQELVKRIESGWFDFDVVIATPDMMKDIGKLGAILGRRGLMPSVKLKTITFDIKNIVQEFKNGRLFFKSDKSGTVHCKIGNVLMEEAHLIKNGELFHQKVIECKPIGLKGLYVKSTYISSTMGLSYKIRQSH